MEHNFDSFHPFVLNVGLARHDADWNWKNVSSPFARLYYVTEGSANVVFSDRTVRLTPGHMYFIPPFAHHSYVCDSCFCHYYAHIYEAPQAVQLFLEDWELPGEVEAGATELALFGELCRLNPFMKLTNSDPSAYDNSMTLASNLRRNQQRPLFNKMASRGIVYRLLSPFFKVAAPKGGIDDERVKKAVLYIRHHLAEPIRIEQVADALCVSKNYFIRIFKRATGDTPVSFIIRRKVERAQLLLLTGNQPIKHVAIAVGFEDFSYFNRVFKKQTGLTPSEYRRGESGATAFGKEKK